MKSRQHIIEIAKIKDDKELEVQSLLGLAESLKRREAKNEARDVYKQILEIDPENTTAHEMLVAFEQPKDFIDLGAVLRNELVDEKKGGIQSMDGLIAQFRREVFESIGEGDFHSRYDLGVAYKGMGLYQEAIEEFEIAAKDRELKLKAYEMIGSCFLELGKIEDAMRVLNEGLKIADRPRREYFGIHFLLATCYEEQKDIKKALRQYLKAYQIDKTVPDLARKLSELKTKLEAKLKTQGKKIARKKKPRPKSVKTRKVSTKKSKITYL